MFFRTFGLLLLLLAALFFIKSDVSKKNGLSKGCAPLNLAELPLPSKEQLCGDNLVEGIEIPCTFSWVEDFIAAGDLNNDSCDDAAAVLNFNTGGSGNFRQLHVFLNEEGQPKQVAAEDLGDRVVIHSVAIQEGKVTVAMTAHGPEDPLCCPTVEKTVTFEPPWQTSLPEIE